MIVHASGFGATVDLFEHHLVISRQRRGVLLDSAVNELLIPLSSIKSVQFIRPGILSPGRLILTLAGQASTRHGTANDPNTVLFSKRELGQFEYVVRAIQEAIAMPSIERMAMASQHRAQVDYGSAPAGERQIVRRSRPPSDNGHASYANSFDSDAHQGRGQRSTLGDPPPSNDRGFGGWWRDVPIVGKFIFVALGLILLLSMCSHGDGSPDDASASPAQAGQTAQATPSTEDMMSAWAGYALGERRTNVFPLVDGSGKPGEFCTSTNGKVTMIFGDRSPKAGVPQSFDQFARFDVATGMELRGRFWFDQANHKLTFRDLVRGRPFGSVSEPAKDMTVEVQPVAPGIVQIDGATFHYCVL
jgi:hypothetical protein